MSNKSRQNADSVSNSITAVLSILNGNTPINIKDSKEFSITLNPFTFIMGILQPIVGYDEIVNFLSELNVYGLPMFEDAVKITLIQSLKDLFSCSVNPIINEELIRNGVVLDLKSIDLLNIMNRCPLDKENNIKKINGGFFYFDVDNYTVPDQLIRCKDLNAVIWYVKHKATDRTVWYGYETQADEHPSLLLNSQPCLEDGVITMEYNDKASQLRDSQNNPMRVQVPYDNCLHVFLGNTKGVATNISLVQDSETISSDTETLITNTQEFQSLLTTLEETLGELKTELTNSETIEEKAEIQCEINLCEMVMNGVNNDMSVSEILPNLLIDSNTGKYYFTLQDKKISISEYVYTHKISDLVSDNQALITNINAYTENPDLQYRNPEDNYYYHKTLFEFNTDYVMSVKFFDSKVVAAQIVDILTGCFAFSLNISFEERLIQNEVEKILTKVLENNDVTINDCFFSFTNDDYNLMLDETEKERLGEYTGDDYAYGTKIDYDTIYNELNQVSSSATLSEQVSTITRTMNAISRSLTPEMYSDEKEWELNFNFLNNLLKGLTLSLVYNIVSPKIYMLMAINLKIMGRDPNFDLSKFIELFKTLLVSVVRGIANKIMGQMKEWLLSLISDLVKRLADRLMFEQAEYYTRLLMKCMMAFRMYWSGENWNMANVEYADIYCDDNVEVGNTTC